MQFKIKYINIKNKKRILLFDFFNKNVISNVNTLLVIDK